MDPILISIAPNGARKTKRDLPQLPVTSTELAAEAAQCAAAGAALIHLHIRDAKEGHILDATQYKGTARAIDRATKGNMIVQITTEAVGIYKPEQQMQVVLDAKPAAVSIAIRELIKERSDEGRFQDFLEEITKLGVWPQYILYSPEEVRYFADLKKRGIIPAGVSFLLFVLGKKQAVVTGGSAAAQPEDLDKFLETFDQGLVLAETQWAICAFGERELDCMLYAVKCGGHVRIGFENNHLMKDGSIAQDNAALVKQFTAALREHNITRPIATKADLAKLFTRKAQSQAV